MDLKKKGPAPLIDRFEVVSRPGSTLVVKRVRLTDAGRKALSTGSTGISDGAPKEGRYIPVKKRDLEPA